MQKILDSELQHLRVLVVDVNAAVAAANKIKNPLSAAISAKDVINRQNTLNIAFFQALERMNNVNT